MLNTGPHLMNGFDDLFLVQVWSEMLKIKERKKKKRKKRKDFRKDPVNC